MKHILIILLIILLLFLSGCSWFEDKRVVAKLKPVDIRDRWKVLAPFVKNYFETDMSVAEIARWLEAEYAYQQDIIARRKGENDGN